MASISAECPICFERYSGPIFNCETGHSICGQCTTQVSQCPTCRAPMTKGRNFTLEAILVEFAQSSTSRNLECSFKECRVKFQSQDDAKSHEKECEFRDVLCGSCNTSVPYGDFIYHLIQDHKVQEKSMELQIGINMDKIKSKDGEKYILYNEDGENLLVNMMAQNGLFYIWIEHLKYRASSSGIREKFKVKFWRNGQPNFSLSVECPILGFRSASKTEILEHHFPISLKQMENFQRTGSRITSIIVSADGPNLKSQVKNFGRQLSSKEGASGLSERHFDKIQIKDLEFILDKDNVQILSSLNENYSIKSLDCRNISARKIPEILQKFKAIQKLDFSHTRVDASGKCKYFNSVGGDCIFKLPQINGLENLKELFIWNLKIKIGDINICPLNLPNLKTLSITYCDIRGELVGAIVSGFFALEQIYLWGNSPLLEKEDVESLLRIKSLKEIHLNTKFDRQVISFVPIGPDGSLFETITQNALIEFERDPNSQPWNMKMTK